MVILFQNLNAREDLLEIEKLHDELIKKSKFLNYCPAS